MAVPYRLFTRLHLLQCRGADPVNAFAAANLWEGSHVESSRLLWRREPSGVDWLRWYVLYKGYAEDGWNQAGADKLVDVVTTVEYLKPYLDNYPTTSFYDQCGAYYDPAWDVNVGTGRHYDGVTEYPAYPHRYHSYSAFNVAGHTVLPADLPLTREVVHEAWCNFIHDAISLHQSAYVLEKGMVLGMTAFDPSQGFWAAGEGLGLDINIKRVLLRYFNATVNTLTPNRGSSAGGWPLVLTGLGFSNADDELNENSGPANTHAWSDTVSHVYIERLDGTVVATLQPGPPWNHFTVDSNTQLTITSMPALAAGVYQLRIRKQPDGVDTYSYAGDWRTDPDGRMTPGARLYIYIGATPPRRRIIRTKWVWKKGALSVFKAYAPIDIRTLSTFYEGMLLGASPFTRGTNDQTGFPLFPDMDLELDNTSKEFSKLLASYWCKNQLVEVYSAWREDPEAFHDLVYSGLVDDYDRPGPTWRVKLRDISEKYFNVKLPRLVCTETDYPNIHKNHRGRRMPEVLGTASLTEGADPGAVEAVYIDTTIYKYLASRGSLYEVDEVYSDGQLKTETTDYTISYEDGGRTYITFTSDQGDAKITFNCKGYTYEGWDSAAGYVQNPAYILLFLLAFFTEIPDIFVDIPAFDDLATRFTAAGFGTSGYLIMQDEKNAPEYVQELLFTYGVKLWTTPGNMLTVGRKDVSDFASSSVIYFNQIDCLQEPERIQGFAGAVNYADIKWEHYPTANLYRGAQTVSRESSITALEAEVHPSSAWEFPWTTSATLAALRANEELLKLGFGDQKIKLTVSLEHAGELDILDTFRFQDPYGLHPTGGGEQGRYYYVERIETDLLGGKITITGIDLQWILRQLVVLGDENVEASTWSSATEANRLYGYLADELTGLLPDGEPGKVLWDENG